LFDTLFDTLTLQQLKGDEAALAEDFTFSLASFLIAASDTAFFGYR
jgi:hypothetical protein